MTKPVSTPMHCLKPAGEAMHFVTGQPYRRTGLYATSHQGKMKIAHVTGHCHHPHSFRCWTSRNDSVVTQTTAHTTRVPTDNHTPEKGQTSGICASSNSASASTSASTSSSASTLRSSAYQEPSAGPSVHSTLLAPQHTAKLSGKTEDPPESAAINSGRTQAYHNWWQQEPSNICLFGAHLIGDAEEPSQYASMALTDLAFCRLGFRPLYTCF